MKQNKAITKKVIMKTQNEALQLSGSRNKQNV